MKAVKINPAEIPVDVYETACRILSKSVRSFFEDESNRRGYEEWMKTPEGQRADLSKEDRMKFNRKGATA